MKNSRFTVLDTVSCLLYINLGFTLDYCVFFFTLADDFCWANMASSFFSSMPVLDLTLLPPCPPSTSTRQVLKLHRHHCCLA